MAVSYVIEVSTAQELVNTLNSLSTTSIVVASVSDYSDCTIRLTTDIDMNNSPYYSLDGNFFNFGMAAFTPEGESTTTRKPLIIDGDGHTISNIYCFNRHTIFNIRQQWNGANADRIYLKNITIEAITNDAFMFWKATNYQDPGLICDSVIFNVKMYSLSYGDTESGGALIDGRSCFVYFSGGDDGKLEFINCIFNLFIMSTRLISDSLSSDGRIAVLFRGYGYTQWIASSQGIHFNGCIFKIRNQTNKNIFIVSYEGGNQPSRFVFRNCGVFYNEIGPTQPKYGYIDMWNYESGFCRQGRGNCTIDNSFVAAFGSLKEGFTRPIFIFSASASYTSNSFYDKDKIRGECNNTYDYNVSGTCAALTTEQCKDRDKLSEIGYIFCEES